jgi:hypothetical protein
MLLIFNELSPVLKIATEIKCGVRFAFKNGGDLDALIQAVADEWFIKGRMREFTKPDLAAFRPYTAEGMTQRLAACFDRAVTKHLSAPGPTPRTPA